MKGDKVDFRVKRLPERDAISAGEIVLTVVWIIGQVILTLALSFLVFLNSMNVAGCGPNQLCNLDLAQASVFITPIAGVIAVVVTTVLSVIFAPKGQWMWLAPAVGFFILVVAFAVAMILNNASLHS